LRALSENGRVDLLFSDVVMPGGMNGPQLAQAAVKVCPGLKVLFTSGYSESAIADLGRLDGDVQLLQKPYRREDLATRLRQVLDGG
jgi:DNA-binding LytR/AlgR family response regulator